MPSKEWLARFRLHERVAARHHAQLVDSLGIEKGARVLDAGCGLGGFARLLSRATGPKGRVVAVDLDDDFVAGARETGPADVEYWTADIAAMPFADGEFDVVWCANVLRWTADPGAVGRELMRVLKPGGRMALVEGGPPTRLFRADALLRGLEESIEMSTVDSSFKPPTGWPGFMADLGLRDVAARSFPFEFSPPLDADQEAWVLGRLDRLYATPELSESNRTLIGSLMDEHSDTYAPRLPSLHVSMVSVLNVGRK